MFLARRAARNRILASSNSCKQCDRRAEIGVGLRSVAPITKYHEVTNHAPAVVAVIVLQGDGMVRHAAHVLFTLFYWIVFVVWVGAAGSKGVCQIFVVLAYLMQL